ncbi:MAG: hypothetical protein FXF54_01270 [Kosmotoga sp.]|nr:MAG: hypothetical protein FXF54_01270 [Kosmotoga sp.]
MDNRSKFYFEHIKSDIDEIIENRECNMNALLDYKKNVELMNIFYGAGVQDRHDVLKALWKVASNITPEFAEDTKNSGFEIIIWKYIPLKEILNELELNEEKFNIPNGNHSNNRIYLKFSYKPGILKCLSLHFSDYF